MKIVFVYLMVFAFANCCCDGKLSAYRTIETHDGRVRGRLNHTLFHNISYYSYLGIPYAEKPINDLRFKVWLCFSLYPSRRLCFRLSSAFIRFGPANEFFCVHI